MIRCLYSIRLELGDLHDLGLDDKRFPQGLLGRRLVENDCLVLLILQFASQLFDLLPQPLVLRQLGVEHLFVDLQGLLDVCELLLIRIDLQLHTLKLELQLLDLVFLFLMSILR